MKSIITLICIAVLCTVAWSYPRYDNPDDTISKLKHIKRVDVLSPRSGNCIIEIFTIREHEYIVVESSGLNGGVQIIHAESCPCKSGSASNQCADGKRS